MARGSSSGRNRQGDSKAESRHGKRPPVLAVDRLLAHHDLPFHAGGDLIIGLQGGSGSAHLGEKYLESTGNPAKQWVSWNGKVTTLPAMWVFSDSSSCRSILSFHSFMFHHFHRLLPLLVAAPAIFLPLIGSARAQETPAVSDLPDRAKSSYVVIEDGGTGPHPAVATQDWTLPGMTIFRPRDLSPFGEDTKLPIVLWGNGACANTTQEHKNFLSELASNGYVIVAIGLLDQIEERGPTSRERTESRQLLTGLDWILAENESTESIYFGKMDGSKVAAMGMSCGGLQAIQISSDPRITTTVVCNSGVLPEPSPRIGMPPLPKDVLKTFHGPVLYLMGGPSDIAYENAMDDFSRVEQVPIVMTNLDVGHGGTYAQPHGGKYTPVALAWLDWHLKDKKEASSMFLGHESTLMRDPDWSIETKNFDN